MRHLALAALLLPTLAACDSAAPGDALVGTWTLTSGEFAYVVTSRTSQAVPDLAAQPSGAITASGAATATLDYVVDLYGDRDLTQLFIASENPETASGPFDELIVSQYITDGAEVSGNLNVASGQTYGVYLQVAAPRLTHDGGRFTLAPVPLEGGVSIAGTLVYPEIALRPGEPTEVPQRFNPNAFDGTVTFTFEEGGTLSVTATEGNRAETFDGSWELTGDGSVRIGIRDGTVTEFSTYAFAVTGGTLRLEGTGGQPACNAECVGSLEGFLFAEDGSFDAVAPLERYVLREGGASARAAAGTAPVTRRPPAAAGAIGRVLAEGAGRAPEAR